MTWQATWLYLACLLRNGELYEQLGAREDALTAFKEGFIMVSRPFQSCLTLCSTLTLSSCSAKMHCMEICPTAWP